MIYGLIPAAFISNMNAGKRHKGALSCPIHSRLKNFFYIKRNKYIV